MARRLHLGGNMARSAPRLSLPGKLVFPSAHNSGHFSMLGLGDIVMPGLLLCFVMRYDAYKKAQVRLCSTAVVITRIKLSLHIVRVSKRLRRMHKPMSL